MVFENVGKKVDNKIKELISGTVVYEPNFQEPKSKNKMVIERAQ